MSPCSFRSGIILVRSISFTLLAIPIKLFAISSAKSLPTLSLSAIMMTEALIK
jgi:hypothetical protein